MRADGRFGGHFVQGHVDGIGTVRDIRPEGDARWLTVAFSPVLAPLFVLKGSVAVDGVSLTVAGLDEDHFDVMIIPFTWTHTSLGSLQVGAKVNLECDVVGKYVARARGRELHSRMTTKHSKIRIAKGRAQTHPLRVD